MKSARWDNMKSARGLDRGGGIRWTLGYQVKVHQENGM